MRTIIFIYLYTSAAEAAEKAGMPQLDPSVWAPQIFWLIITFGFLYLVIWKVILPRLSDSIEQRNDHISDNLDEAKKVANEAEILNKSYEEIILKAKNEASKIILNNKKDINQKLFNIKKETEKIFDKKLKEVEKDINLMKKESITDVEKIALDLSDNIIFEMTGNKIDKKNIEDTIKEIIKNEQSRELN
tara:strand:+ start:908 stop:1477 length:570 start_codon:yes stop_codon:yes gene_type:complete